MRPILLIVDDSKTVRIIVKKAFKGLDCEVLEAGNGVEGLALACSRLPVLIFLDVTMPVMGGLDTLAKLQADPELRDIPVVMLVTEEARGLVTRGARDRLVKPFKREALLEKTARIIDLHPAASRVAMV